jgi:hypothetical protein
VRRVRSEPATAGIPARPCSNARPESAGAAWRWSHRRLRARVAAAARCERGRGGRQSDSFSQQSAGWAARQRGSAPLLLGAPAVPLPQLLPQRGQVLSRHTLAFLGLLCLRARPRAITLRHSIARWRECGTTRTSRASLSSLSRSLVTSAPRAATCRSAQLCRAGACACAAQRSPRGVGRCER